MTSPVEAIDFRLAELDQERDRLVKARALLDGEGGGIPEPKAPRKQRAAPKRKPATRPRMGRPRNESLYEELLATVKEHGPVKVPQLAEIARVPQGSLYKALDRLESEGKVQLDRQRGRGGTTVRLGSARRADPSLTPSDGNGAAPDSDARDAVLALFQSGAQLGPAGVARELDLEMSVVVPIVGQLFQSGEIMRASGQAYKVAA